MNSEKLKDPPRPIKDHLRELRRRLIISVSALLLAGAASLFFSDRILELLMAPLARALPAGSSFIALGPMDAWFAQMKAALAAGAFASSPVIFYQAWAFAAPAIGKRGRQKIAFVAALSAALFAAGALACYALLLPYAFEYFVAAGAASNVAMMPGINGYLGFILTALVAFGLVFQAPLVTALLATWEIVPIEKLRKMRKYVIVAAFILAAIATPPDPISQIAVAIPLLVLYELSILSVRIFRRSASDDQAKSVGSPSSSSPPLLESSVQIKREIEGV